jgi:hypothetical protein
MCIALISVCINALTPHLKTQQISQSNKVYLIIYEVYRILSENQYQFKHIGYTETEILQSFCMEILVCHEGYVFTSKVII